MNSSALDSDLIGCNSCLHPAESEFDLLIVFNQKDMKIYFFMLVFFFCIYNGHSQDRITEGIFEYVGVRKQDDISKKKLVSKLRDIGMNDIADDFMYNDSSMVIYYVKGDSLWGENARMNRKKVTQNYYQIGQFAMIVNPEKGLKTVISQKNDIKKYLDENFQGEQRDQLNPSSWFTEDYTKYKRIKNKTKQIQGYNCTLYRYENNGQNNAYTEYWIAEEIHFVEGKSLPYFFSHFATPFGLIMESNWEFEGISNHTYLSKATFGSSPPILPFFSKINFGQLDSIQYADEGINQHLEGKKIENASIIPDFSFYPVGKPEPVNLYAQRGSGKFMLLDLWATWCGPCIKDFPIIRQLGENNAATLEIIGLNTGDHREDFVQNFIQKNNMTWQQAYAGRALGLFLNPNKSIPFAILLDDQMKVRWMGNPAQHWGEIESIIRNR